MIRFLKERLSIAERANGDGRWVQHLPDVLRDYNDSLIRGTDVRRRDVDQNNYLDLLGKLRHTSEPSILMNMAESLRQPTALARFLWRYSVGDKVLLARRVDYALKDRQYFEKPSVVGAYGPVVYTITACRTKLNASYFLCPVYALTPLARSGTDPQPLTGLFYESELSPATFARGDGDASPPRRREKRRRRRVSS